MNLSPTNLLDLDHIGHKILFDGCVNVWDALPLIEDYLQTHARADQAEGVIIEEGAYISGAVMIGSGTVIEAGAYVRGPTIIGARCEIRSGAFIRGTALVGDGCIVGNSTELKNTVMLD